MAWTRIKTYGYCNIIQVLTFTTFKFVKRGLMPKMKSCRFCSHLIREVGGNSVSEQSVLKLVCGNHCGCNIGDLKPRMSAHNCPVIKPWSTLYLFKLKCKLFGKTIPGSRWRFWQRDSKWTYVKCVGKSKLLMERRLTIADHFSVVFVNCDRCIVLFNAVYSWWYSADSLKLKTL